MRDYHYSEVEAFLGGSRGMFPWRFLNKIELKRRPFRQILTEKVKWRE